MSRSPGRSPARASTTSTATSASASAARACCWIWRARSSRSSRSTPPVSISVSARPFHSVVELLAVAGDPGELVHDRLARLGEPVDQRGLPDVRISDDRDLHGPVEVVGSLAQIAGDHERRDPLDHLLDVSPVVSSTTASVGGAQRRVRARAVALVADRLLGEHAARVDPELGRAPPRALGRIGGQEHLELGVRRDDRADVAPLGDPVAAGAAAAAARRPSPRAPPARRRPARRPPTPRGVRIASVTSRPSSSTRSPSSIRTARRRSPRDRRRRSQRCERDAAVHRAGVEVGEPERERRARAPRSTCRRPPDRRSRPPSGARTLGPSRPDSRHSSKNVGQVLPTTSGSSSSTGTCVPISENAIAIRWSS